jgi:hypothetical protein
MLGAARSIAGGVRTIAARAVLAAALLAACASAGGAGEPAYSPALLPFLDFGAPNPPPLPAHFRNHCRYDVTTGGFYCSNHCGSDYEFFYCSPRSFGCCHIGVGYCDWRGLLRCRP